MSAPYFFNYWREHANRKLTALVYVGPTSDKNVLEAQRTQYIRDRVFAKARRRGSRNMLGRKVRRSK